MPPIAVKCFIALMVLVALAAGPLSARAEFTKTDDKLFVGWLELAVNRNPETEYGAYAIVQTGGENLPVTYVIFSSFKGKMAVHGAFRCDKEFAVLETHSNGHYDIQCVKQDVFGQKTVTILRYGDSGLYEEHY